MRGSLVGSSSSAVGFSSSLSRQYNGPVLVFDPLAATGSRRPVPAMSVGMDRRRSRRSIGSMEAEGDRFWRRAFEERVPRSHIQSANVADGDFLGRLALAWNVLFPTRAHQSVAQIAKARLRHCLQTDRLQISPQLRHHLCTKIVNTMAEYVVVDRQADVQFDVQRSPEVGSVYSIKVPVTRVKPALQEAGRRNEYHE